MNLPKNWPLVDPCDDGLTGLRKDRCEHCGQIIGHPHLYDCLMVTKRIRFRCMIVADMDVPYWQSKKNIQERFDVSFDLLSTLSISEIDDFWFQYIKIIDSTPRRDLRNQN